MSKQLKSIRDTLFLLTVFFAVTVCPAAALTLLYSGEEHGQLGLHGCGTEQVGGLAHRQTLLSDLRSQHDAVLTLHTGNLIDPSDTNAEWIYQIGLAALDALQTDVLCLGPNEVSLSEETLAAVHANHPDIAFVCANVTETFATPYLIRETALQQVAIVGIVSENHALAPLSVAFRPAQTALAGLKTELLKQSDAVVVVFHGTIAEAHALAEKVPWIDALIAVSEDEPKDPMEPPEAATFIGKPAIVRNASLGAAVGVLEMTRAPATAPFHKRNASRHRKDSPRPRNRAAP